MGRMAMTSSASGRSEPPLLSDHRALLDGADAQDAGLGLVDDGRGEQAARGAVVGQGEGAALHLLGAQLLRPGAFGQVVDGARQAQQALLVRIADHRHDQARRGSPRPRRCGCAGASAALLR